MTPSGQPTRRSLLKAAAAAASAAVVAPLAACADGSPGPALSEGSLPSRFMTSPVRWRMALPGSGTARGLVVALHGFGSSADMAFDLGLADSVEPTRTALVSVDGGNGYWHRPRRRHCQGWEPIGGPSVGFSHEVGAMLKGRNGASPPPDDSADDTATTQDS